jgi:NADH-quinone oxidoreductase subunit L
MPIAFVTMTIGFAALAGLPPTAGFVSKDALLAAIYGATGLPRPVAVFCLVCAVLTVPVTACYATRSWLRTFFGPAVAGRDASPSMSLPMIALAVPALLLGAVAVAVPSLRPDPLGALISLALVLLGVLGGYRVRVRWTRVLAVNTVYERTVVPAVFAIARVVAGADDRLLEGPVGEALRRGQNGNVQTYLSGLVLGLLVVAVGVVVLR